MPVWAGYLDFCSDSWISPSEGQDLKDRDAAFPSAEQLRHSYLPILSASQEANSLPLHQLFVIRLSSQVVILQLAFNPGYHRMILLIMLMVFQAQKFCSEVVLQNSDENVWRSSMGECRDTQDCGIMYGKLLLLGGANMFQSSSLHRTKRDYLH